MRRPHHRGDFAMYPLYWIASEEGYFYAELETAGFPSVYVHRLSMKSDTGIRLENLTKQVYVALDIFHAFMQNKPIETPLYF